MRTLIYAEHDNQHLKGETAKVVGAAGALNTPIDVLVAGHNVEAVVADAVRLSGVERVLVADASEYVAQLAENIALLVHSLSSEYDYILAPATTTGKNFLPRVAALCDVPQLSDVIAIESSDTFVRPIYAGNAIATVQSSAKKHVLTVRASAFDAVVYEGNAEVTTIESIFNTDGASFVSAELSASERPELTAASVVVSGGRGMQNGKNFALLEGIADKLNAAIGASRAAVDAGFVPNDMQVGQTGKIVAPDLYIAVGISGAIQHLAGMKDSKVIVAINKDEEAPIFQVADYGLVGDLFEILPELENSL
ncbi:FAD-binding protein [Alteromonas sp. LMIT006]|uniref:electron transfer flavoprotein subunit alpha/FixB family protein n=1 Tax=Alteromonadaceae TaxID=72275 RepID=UPI0020CA558B|nr:FAD-binding protein [Alteromonas sp. LMIT006]UTP72017.1 FAD-binding protein [Alteromonas sp. LMIT006]